MTDNSEYRVSLEREVHVVVDYEKVDTGVYSGARLGWDSSQVRMLFDVLFGVASREERIASLKFGRQGIEAIFVPQATAFQPPIDCDPGAAMERDAAVVIADARALVLRAQGELEATLAIRERLTVKEPAEPGP